MEIQGDSRDWSIGQLARASGVPIKTVRFYSDAGLLPAARTSAGHRRYDPSDLARLQLIRSLRSLEVDLPTITSLLADSTDLQETLRLHVMTLQVRVNAVRRQLAVACAAAEAPPDAP